MEKKFCKDCKYATPRYSNISFCMNPQNLVISQVDGEVEFDRSCGNLRENDKKCGPTAAWFEPKEPT